MDHPPIAVEVAAWPAGSRDCRCRCPGRPRSVVRGAHIRVVRLKVTFEESPIIHMHVTEMRIAEENVQTRHAAAFLYSVSYLSGPILISGRTWASADVAATRHVAINSHIRDSIGRDYLHTDLPRLARPNVESRTPIAAPGVTRVTPPSTVSRDRPSAPYRYVY